MSIFIVRHGETAWNAARIVQLPETPLNARGMAQAERLGVRLAAAGAARILTSDLRRAAMTAERIAARTGAPVVIEPLLRERDFGAVRGTAYADLPCDIFAPDYAPPGGESWEAFRARVARAWEVVAVRAIDTGGHLVVVTHGLVCQVLAERHIRRQHGAASVARWENTSVTEVDTTPPWTVRVLNCTRHLEDDPGAADTGSAL